MRKYCVFKGEELIGPFTIQELQEFVRSGLVLTRDIAFSTDDPDAERPVETLLKSNGLSCKVEHKGNIFKQISDIGKELILPSMTFTKEPWKQDNKLFVLSLIGITMSVILVIAELFSPHMIFYAIALYFSAVWGVLFHYLFKTLQVNLKLATLIFFVTQGVIIVAYNFLGISSLNPFYYFLESENGLVRLCSYIFGVGFVEETVKFLPVLFILLRSKDVLTPQTVVYYGLISGISFGVFEGVEYQTGVNFAIMADNPNEAGYAYSFLYNIARLTCLPFLHAIWAGISAYFGAFAFLYPRYRRSLFALAILIPATLHGFYDYFCGVSQILTVPITLIAVILLMVYLKINYSFHSKLAD